MFGARYASTMIDTQCRRPPQLVAMIQGVFGLSVHKYRSARLYRLVYFAAHRNTILPPRRETCQTTRLGFPARRQSAGPGFVRVALSMRSQTKQGRRWRFRPALQRPIGMPCPSGSLSAGSRADCMTSLLSPRTGIHRLLGSCEATIARWGSLGNDKSRFVCMADDRTNRLTAPSGEKR